MDIEQVLQARANRGTRLARPFENFFEVIQSCAEAGELLLSGSVDSKVEGLLARSAVVSTVSAIEVYYRDILDFIFRYCEPSFFEQHLKHLFPEKFDITDILAVYRHQIHPLELVTAAQSFQNSERIDKVFSRFLDEGGLWTNVLKLQVRVKDQPETESSWGPDELQALKRVFSLRHELVHDPANRSFFSQETLNDIWSSAHMVFGSDLLLYQAIQAHRDPLLDKDA